MKKIFQLILLCIVFIASYLFVMSLFSWVEGDGYIITSQEIKQAVITGIVVSFVMALSKRIKSTWLYIAAGNLHYGYFYTETNFSQLSCLNKCV